MTKKISLLLLKKTTLRLVSLSIMTFICLSATVYGQEQSCRYGFSFEISNDPHWGKDKPVITSV